MLRMGIQSKLERYLGSVDVSFINEEDDSNIIERLVHFVSSLDVSKLDDDQAAELDDIMADIEEDEYTEEDDDDMDEAVKRVKIKRSARKAHKLYYKANKAKLKMLAKKYRKSSRGKMLAKKAAKMAKRGRTATGKRKVTYV
jgi:hypothetical protein